MFEKIKLGKIGFSKFFLGYLFCISGNLVCSTQHFTRSYIIDKVCRHMGNVYYISCIRCQVSLCYFVLSAIETVTQQIVCLFFLTSFHSKVLKSHSSHELCFLLVDIRLHSCGIRMILNYIKTITDSQVILLLQTITI